MINHGLHNFIASALTLPMELSFDDLEHLYKQDGYGLWKDSWQGAFSIKQWCFIAVWVLLGAVTLGCLVRDYGTAGISIPYFWLVYCFSIGFSRSSGGRYVVPINWVPMLLLAFCIRMIEKRGEYAPSPAKTESLKKWKPVCTQAALVLFFTAMVLFENLMPQTDTTTAEGDLAFLQGKLSDVSIDWDLVKHQQEQGLMQVTHGKVVYPRFYYYLKGEHTRTDVQMEKDYSRMTFSGINKEGWRNLMQDYLLPHQELIHEFPHDSIFRAISCTSSYGYQDVLAMTVETPGGEIYTYVRDPFAEFSCPVPEPVCIERDNCR